MYMYIETVQWKHYPVCETSIRSHIANGVRIKRLKRNRPAFFGTRKLSNTLLPATAVLIFHDEFHFNIQKGLDKYMYVVVCLILPAGKAISAIGGGSCHIILKWAIPAVHVVSEVPLTPNGVRTHWLSFQWPHNHKVTGETIGLHTCMSYLATRLLMQVSFPKRPWPKIPFERPRRKLCCRN